MALLIYASSSAADKVTIISWRPCKANPFSAKCCSFSKRNRVCTSMTSPFTSLMSVQNLWKILSAQFWVKFSEFATQKLWFDEFKGHLPTKYLDVLGFFSEDKLLKDSYRNLLKETLLHLKNSSLFGVCFSEFPSKLYVPLNFRECFRTYDVFMQLFCIHVLTVFLEQLALSLIQMSFSKMWKFLCFYITRKTFRVASVF